MGSYLSYITFLLTSFEHFPGKVLFILPLLSFITPTSNFDLSLHLRVDLSGDARDVHVSDALQQVSAGRALLQVLGGQHQLRRHQDDIR